MTPIGEFCDAVTDNCDPAEANGLPYLGLEHLASGFPAIVAVGDPTEVRSAKTLFRERDILYGKLRPYLRKAVLAPFDGMCSTDIIVLRARHAVLPEFIAFLVHSDQFVDRAKATTAGVNHPRTSWNKLKPFVVPVPPMEEQRKIATVLSAVQRAIEQQERLIALTTELKKALMHKLFTEGARGEPQKQTEIGPIPQSWEVQTLGTFSQIKHGFAFDGQFFKPSGDLILMTPGHFYEDGGFRDQKDKTKYYTGVVPDGYVLSEGDLLVAMTEQKSGLLGSPAFVPESGKYVHNQRLGLIEDLDESRLLRPFLFHMLSTPHVRGELSKTATGSKVRHTSPGKIRAVVVGVPGVSEQDVISSALDVVDSKRRTHVDRRHLLQSLFRTLLHQLMTAQIRVNDVDLSPLGLPAHADEMQEVA